MSSTKIVIKDIPGLGHRMNYTQQRSNRRGAGPNKEIKVAWREYLPEEQEIQNLADTSHTLIASVGIQMGMTTADWMAVRTMVAGSR